MSTKSFYSLNEIRDNNAFFVTFFAAAKSNTYAASGYKKDKIMDNKTRCSWCNLNNPLYVKYHDEEWCQPRFDDGYLYEMLILESFQAGLSW